MEKEQTDNEKEEIKCHKAAPEKLPPTTANTANKKENPINCQIRSPAVHPIKLALST